MGKKIILSDEEIEALDRQERAKESEQRDQLLLNALGQIASSMPDFSALEPLVVSGNKEMREAMALAFQNLDNAKDIKTLTDHIDKGFKTMTSAIVEAVRNKPKEFEVVRNKFNLITGIKVKE